MLVRVENVGIAAIQEIGDGRDQPFLIGATDKQDGSILHGWAMEKKPILPHISGFAAASAPANPAVRAGYVAIMRKY